MTGHTISFNFAADEVQELVERLHGTFDWRYEGERKVCTFHSDVQDAYIHLHNAVRRGVICEYSEYIVWKEAQA